MLQVPFVKISVEDPAQDFLNRFSIEAAVQDLCAVQGGDLREGPQRVRSLLELSILIRDLQARPLLSS